MNEKTTSKSAYPSKLAEVCGKYLQKGRQVAVVGRIQTRSWDDQEGKKRFVTEVVAEEAYFADSKREQEHSTPVEGWQPPMTDDDELPF